MSTLHPAESIMREVSARFAAMRNVSVPTAGAENSLPHPSMCVVPGGTYIGDLKRVYLVEVSAGGVSGEAECIVTDTTVTGEGNDSLGEPAVIISRVAIPLGALGASITFHVDPGYEFQAGDVWTITCDTYRNTIQEVIRAKAVGVQLKNYPAAVIARGPQRNEAHENQIKVTMLVLVEVWIQEIENIDAELVEAQADIEQAIYADPTLNGLAFDTIIVGFTPDVPEQGRPYGVVQAEIEVTFFQNM